MTHLFRCDVFNSPLDNLQLTQPILPFGERFDVTIQQYDQSHSILDYQQNRITFPFPSNCQHVHQTRWARTQHPRTNAISSYMSTTNRCLQYAHQEIWLGYNKKRPILANSIRDLYLYSDWETSNDRTWTIFRKYVHDFTSICCTEAHSYLDYAFNASLNKSRETIKEHTNKKNEKRSPQR